MKTINDIIPSDEVTTTNNDNKQDQMPKNKDHDQHHKLDHETKVDGAIIITTPQV